MVEARGVEPLSESPSIYTSPGAGCCLDFPHTADGSQAAAGGILLIQWRYEDSFRHRSPLVDAQIQSHGTLWQDGKPN